MLKKILIAKIALTILLWAIPLTFFPSSIFNRFGIPINGSYVFIRLLGLAYFALVIGYWEGLYQIKNGKISILIPFMSIISNGGAAIIIVFFWISGEFSKWSQLGKIYFEISAVILSLITLSTFAATLKKR